jgi:hypothetical protein
MSNAAFAALLALILTLPPTVVISFNIGTDLYIFHGGSNVNEAPAPIIGAGLPILVLMGGAYWVARRLRRNRVGTQSS